MDNKVQLWELYKFTITVEHPMLAMAEQIRKYGSLCKINIEIRHKLHSTEFNLF